MGMIWDFLMRRKPLLVGLLLIFIISAAFSSVYLRPAVTPMTTPVNLPASTPANEIVTPALESEPLPEPTPEPVIDTTVHLAIVAPTPDEVVALGESVVVPRTNFGFTLPGNIVNFASLGQAAADRQLAQVDAVKTWHYIVSATTAALIFGAVMVCLARFLSKNMLE